MKNPKRENEYFSKYRNRVKPDLRWIAKHTFLGKYTIEMVAVQCRGYSFKLEYLSNNS